jgi:hypothetical protein
LGLPNLKRRFPDHVEVLLAELEGADADCIELFLDQLGLDRLTVPYLTSRSPAEAEALIHLWLLIDNRPNSSLWRSRGADEYPSFGDADSGDRMMDGFFED